MGTWKTRKPEPVNIRGICVTCSERPQRNKGKSRFGAECQKCHCSRIGRAYAQNTRNRDRVKKFILECEQCGFIAQHHCQIDLDHIDGNHDNDDESNHQYLCANCHRLKTYQNKDWLCKT